MKCRCYKRMLALTLMATALAACVSEPAGWDNPPAGTTGNEVTVTVTISGQSMPSTRSIDGAGGEAAVQSIDVLVFDGDEKLTERKAGTVVSQSTQGTDDYAVSFTAELTPDGGARTIAVLANVPAATVNTAAVPGDTKAAVLSALTVSNTGKWNATGSSDYTPIPMYGEKSISGIAAGGTVSGIELTRMLARIDVVNSASGFTLSEVYLVNYNTKGYVEPKWGIDNKPVLNIPDDGVPYAGYDNRLTFAYTAPGLSGEIYTYEASTTSGDEGDESHTDAVCLIVKGRRTDDDQDYYYRIDFTAEQGADQNQEYVEYMPVFRNHLYRFAIKRADGRGHDTFDGALGSLGVLNNLKTNLLVVDMAGINDIAFDGRHYLGVNKKEFAVGWDGELEPGLRVATNAAEGWTAASDSDWLTFADTGGQNALGSMGTTTLVLHAEPITELHTSGPDHRTGTVTLSVGRLETHIQVTQYWPVLTLTSSELPESGALMPSVLTQYKINCNANTPHCMVKAYENASETALATFELLPIAPSVIAPCGAGPAVPTTTSSRINKLNIASRELTLTLHYPGVTATREDEPVIGTWSQRYTTHPLNPAFPGFVARDRDTDRLNIVGVGETLYFKFGGIIGSTGGPNCQWFNHFTLAWPTFNPTTITDFTDYQNSYPTNVENAGYASIGGVDVYHTAAGGLNGNGDPCRFIGLDGWGLTDDEVASFLASGIMPDLGAWRLPTKAEWDLSRLGAAQLTVPAAYGEGAIYNAVPYDHGNNTLPGITWDFLPLLGYKPYNTHSGVAGSYEKNALRSWTSNVGTSNPEFGFAFDMTKQGANNNARVFETVQQNNCPVRCVRQ